MPRVVETVDINLPGNHVWTVKKHLSRGDRKYIDRMVFTDQIKLMSELGAAGISLEQITGSLGSILGINVKNANAANEGDEGNTNGTGAPEKTIEDVKKELEEEWTTAKADATIERCTVRWSYDEELSPEAIADTEEHIFDVVVEACKKLYSPRSEEETENLEEASLTH